VENAFFFGCKHYLRGCKIECNECKKFYPCRVCHDKKEGHSLNRKEIKCVQCYNCGEIVPFGRICLTCGFEFGDYCCDECKFIIATPFHNTYHCAKCLLRFILIFFILVLFSFKVIYVVRGQRKIPSIAMNVMRVFILQVEINMFVILTLGRPNAPCAERIYSQRVRNCG
jgi:ribosomal protein L32